jgi:hypothetical protein
VLSELITFQGGFRKSRDVGDTLTSTVMHLQDAESSEKETERPFASAQRPVRE